MTAATLSVYPRSVDELLPEARARVEQLGGVPSRNQLMRMFKVGAPKATELRELLLTEFGPTAPPAVADPTAVPVDPEPVDEPEPTVGPDPVTPRVDPPSVESTPAAVVAEVVTDPEPLAAPDGHPATPTPAERATITEATTAVKAVKLAKMAAEVRSQERLRRTFRSGLTFTQPAPPVQAEVVPVIRSRRNPVVWPVLLLSLPAFVAIWSGWVELGELAGFGMVQPLPGIADDVQINTAITLPIGVETYAAYALWVWLSGRAPGKACAFAKWSALGSLVFGGAGQIAYHLLAAADVASAPWLITAAVSCLPVVVLGMGAALAHLMYANEDE